MLSSSDSIITSYSFEYSIIAGNDHIPPYFAINKDNGQITLIQSLDREQQASYRLTVLVNNKDNKCHKGRTWVTVIVIDENDNSPKFRLSQYTATVKENQAANTLVTTVTATDADSGNNAKLSFSITAGNSDGHFNIDKDGQVHTTQPLNFETKSSYTMTIQGRDGGSPSRSNTTTLTIKVEDLNEPPVFQKSCARSGSCTMSVAENSARVTVIGDLLATDPDHDNCALTYTITTLDAQGVLTIDNSGSVKTQRVLDREMKESYQALVSVKDCGSPALEISTRLTVEVLDKNDNSPVFSPATYSAGISEDVKAGTTVVEVTATGDNSFPPYKFCCYVLRVL